MLPPLVREGKVTCRPGEQPISDEKNHGQKHIAAGFACVIRTFDDGFTEVHCAARLESLGFIFKTFLKQKAGALGGAIEVNARAGFVFPAEDVIPDGRPADGVRRTDSRAAQVLRDPRYRAEAMTDARDKRCRAGSGG